MSDVSQRVAAVGRQLFNKYTRNATTADASAFSQIVKQVYFVVGLPEPSSTDVDRLFAELEGNSKTVSLQRFEAWFDGRLAEPSVKSLLPKSGSEGEALLAGKVTFLFYDVDNSNYLDHKELSLLISDLFLNLGYGEVAPSYIQKAINTLDSSKDGRIQFAEFIPWWQQTLRKKRTKQGHQ
eukprot:TRINITY_DN4758_c0_g1_i1.p1 TRINITY_DN4758_c0_g1~~TRINITY_DN4758_c0_g1_i1.p1  ORF type:complete len:181 (+),score=44.59 TRINITY_DN4758_c0_g1_i1:97-639(+)